MPLRGKRGGLTAAGLHTLFMEDLGVQPGDFVTYLRARARRDRAAAARREARSDIFFLEVKPFEEEFVAAQSQAMGQGGGGRRPAASRAGRSAEGDHRRHLEARRARPARARRQRRSRTSRRSRKAQSELRTARRAGERAGVARDRRSARRRRCGRARPATRSDRPRDRSDGPRRRSSSTSSIRPGALPHEMEALNQLLKAEAENRRRQVSRQQQAGGGGGENRSEADLSTCSIRSCASGSRPTTRRRTPPKSGRRTSRTIRSSAFASWRAGRMRSIASSAISRATASRSKKKS